MHCPLPKRRESEQEEQDKVMAWVSIDEDEIQSGSIAEESE